MLRRQRIVLFGGIANAGRRQDVWLFGPLVPTTTVGAGAGCPGGNGIPVLANTQAALAGPFVLDLISARASAPCAFALSATSQSLSLGRGCTLYVQNPPVVLPAQTNASGFASVGFPVPLNAYLYGGPAYAQGFVLDPSSNPLGVALTGSRNIVIGD